MKVRKIDHFWLLFVSLCGLYEVDATQRMLHRSSRHIKRSMIDADPCLDVNFIDPSKVTFPPHYANLTRPWIRDDSFRPRMFTGSGITYQWAWMKALVVKGLRSSIEEVLQFVARQSCMFIPVGSGVRGIVLRSQPVWLSGEVSCEISALYSSCIKHYGKSACSLYPIEDGGWGEYRLEIGDSSINSTTDQIRAEPITFYGWRTILGEETNKWRYSVDMLALFDDGMGTTYLIDITGKGYRDTCDKRLAPPVEEALWEEWSDKQIGKVMGFYDLRASGFSSGNSQFHAFVNQKISSASKKDSQTFYCEQILKGVVNLGDGTTICYTTYPERESSERISSMREIMIREMGKSWNETIGLAGDEMEAVFRTTKQFFEVRDRLKHRIISSENETDIEETEPKTIIEGKPMIKDIAEIHKRPIVTMSEEPVQLPAEFPSMPNAKPDEKLEFVEPALPEEAGDKDPVAYKVLKEDIKHQKIENGASTSPTSEGNADDTNYDVGVPLPTDAPTDAPTDSPTIPPTDKKERKTEMTAADLLSAADGDISQMEPLQDYEAVDFNSHSSISPNFLLVFGAFMVFFF